MEKEDEAYQFKVLVVEPNMRHRFAICDILEEGEFYGKVPIV